MENKTERKFIGLKELILNVLLSCLLLVISTAVVPLFAPFGMLASSMLALIIPASIGGIIYVLMTTKNPRIGTYFILPFIFGIFFIASGSLVTAIILCISGIFGELSMIGGWKKKWRPLVPYMIHWLFYSFAATFQFLFMRDSILKTYMGMGMDEATASVTVESFAAVYCAPQNMVLTAICAIGASLLGYFIGVKVLHKHFKAAGIV